MQKKPLLVTGAAGFIGSRFVRFCNHEGIPVISVDQKSHFESRPEHKGIDYGQIIDREELFTWLQDQSAGSLAGVIHIGACTDTFQMNKEFLDKVNLQYTQKLWEYCTRHHLPFVYASSAATYGEGQLGYDDDENIIPQLKPLNPYGQSKQDFDIWALKEERSGNHPPSWAGFKFFNVYGFGEGHKGRMASVILHSYRQIKSKGNATLFKSHKAGIADGHQKRDFVFVDDVVRILYFAYNKPIRRGIFNLGSGHARTFLDLAQSVFKALNQPENIHYIDTPIEIRDKYQYFTQANMNKLRCEGYQDPFTSLEQGVRLYVEELENL